MKSKPYFNATMVNIVQLYLSYKFYLLCRKRNIYEYIRFHIKILVFHVKQSFGLSFGKSGQDELDPQNSKRKPKLICTRNN